MKQLKFLMVALTLFMGISLTSCLGESEPITTREAFAKLYSTYGSYTFKTIDGYTITPTYASVASLEGDGHNISGLAGDIVWFYYDFATATVDEAKKTMTDVTLKGVASMNNTVEVVHGTAADKAVNDSIGNAPILSLEGTHMSSPAFVFDQTTLLLNVNYTVTKQENYVSLVYYTDEPEDNGEVLRLHLRYNTKGKDVQGGITSLDLGMSRYYGYLVKAYDLSQVLSTYMAQKGLSSYPTKIQIVTKENPYKVDLEDSETKEKVYTVEYKTSSTN